MSTHLLVFVLKKKLVWHIQAGAEHEQVPGFWLVHIGLQPSLPHDEKISFVEHVGAEKKYCINFNDQKIWKAWWIVLTAFPLWNTHPISISKASQHTNASRSYTDSLAVKRRNITAAFNAIVFPACGECFKLGTHNCRWNLKRFIDLSR